MKLKWFLTGLIPLQLLVSCKTINGQAGVSTIKPDIVQTIERQANGHKYLVIKSLPGCSIVTSSHQAPSIEDKDVCLSVAAAFTDEDLTTVCGNHVVAGKLINGYDDVTCTGHMLCIDNKVQILPNSRLETSLRQAQREGGYLFQQCLIVEKGVNHTERIPQAILDRKAHIIYRALCILSDGSVAVIQGVDKQYPEEFVSGLIALGTVDALYLDMGTWAYGWYRTAPGKTAIEIAERFDNTKYQSNWLIFKRQSR